MSQQTPDPLEFLKSFWGPMGLPMAGMLPTLDVSEIDKRIADMRAVENWLNMNVSMLHMAIQGLELQRATLVAMKGGEQPPGAPPNPAAGKTGKPPGSSGGG